MSSVDVLQSAVDLLSRVPDRRKSIVYIGQGMPVDLDMVAPQAAGLSASGGSSAQMQGVMAGRIRSQMEKVFLNANRANVNVYSFDACGLRVPATRGFPPETCVTSLETNYLRAIADGTGGRAVVDTNEFTPGVEAMFRENASYYLIGFRPGGSAEDGRLHRLEVRVSRPGLEVRTRNGYQSEKPAEARRRAAALAAAPLGAALAGILPKSDLPLQMTAVAIPQPGRRESPVAVIVGVRQPIRQAAERVVERVDLQVSAFDVAGKPFGSRTLRADVAIRAAATGLAEYQSPVANRSPAGPLSAPRRRSRRQPVDERQPLCRRGRARPQESAVDDDGDGVHRLTGIDSGTRTR